ncbi:MAG TPA: sulfatase [Vicinamibacterales bacterium]|nr:sulfatase [Vicinamibacterales bacterium]
MRSNARWWLLTIIAVASVSCSGSDSADAPPNALRLVDLFDPKQVQGAAAPASAPTRIEWRFDGSPAASVPAKLTATHGWQAGPGVAVLAVQSGQLSGRSTTDVPLIHLERTTGLDAPDMLHSVEIRMRASGGANLAVQTSAAATLNLDGLRNTAGQGLWPLQSPLQAGDEVQTYTMTPLAPIALSRVRHVVVRPTDASGASFAIESIRLVSRREHLASIPAGVGWHGLRDIYRESLVAHAPETIRLDVQLPDRPWLDLAVGTVEDGPVTFRVSARPQGSTDAASAVEVDYTVTRPNRWDPYPIDLSRLAGQSVTLSFELRSETPGALGFWGAPVIRALGARPQTARPAATGDGTPPQGVIIVQADTLRRDHLNIYGHSRETAPFLTRMAQEGAVFNHAIANGSWTKVSSPSILTGLYPTTHGVARQTDRLPSSATTMAEAYRSAGYATLSLSSVPFTGQYTNLHQGFEELHESASLPGAGTPLSAKTSREYVDRLLAWIERHREVPFFAYLHIFDPHSPYEPYAPYNTKWSDPARMEAHRQRVQTVMKVVEDPFMRQVGFPNRAELEKVNLDPEEYVRQELDWYDGSIRGMDAELGRLFEQLRRMGLDDRTLVVVTSDHGTEFLDHGRFWHGQSVYGELTNIPLILRWPARVPAGRSIDDLVQMIDIMPTMLDLTGIAHPEGIQGQSLLPFLSAAAAAGTGEWPGWTPRPAISERWPTTNNAPPSQIRESVSIIDGNWKLIHNTVRPDDLPEFELFDYYKDPLNLKNVAADHPEVIARLSKAIAGWKQMATAARVKPDAESTRALSAEELQRLRSLGYVR